MTQQEMQERIRQVCETLLYRGECPPFHVLLSPWSGGSYAFGDCWIHADPTVPSPYVLSQRAWADGWSDE